MGKPSGAALGHSHHHSRDREHTRLGTADGELQLSVPRCVTRQLVFQTNPEFHRGH